MQTETIDKIHKSGRMLTKEEAKRALEEQYNYDFESGKKKIEEVESAN